MHDPFNSPSPGHGENAGRLRPPSNMGQTDKEGNTSEALLKLMAGWGPLRVHHIITTELDTLDAVDKLGEGM